MGNVNEKAKFCTKSLLRVLRHYFGEMNYSVSTPSYVPAELGPFGVHETMWEGFKSVQSRTSASHPLERSELEYNSNNERRQMKSLRRTQGLHAPLRLQMERKAASKVSRLPFMHSSGLMYDGLVGRLETIDFDDVLCQPSEAETMGLPHLMTEKQ